MTYALNYFGRNIRITIVQNFIKTLLVSKNKESASLKRILCARVLRAAEEVHLSS